MSVLAYLEMWQIVLQENLSIGDTFHGTDKHKGHMTFLARYGGMRFIISFNFDLQQSNSNEYKFQHPGNTNNSINILFWQDFNYYFNIKISLHTLR